MKKKLRIIKKVKFNKTFTEDEVYYAKEEKWWEKEVHWQEEIE